MSKLLHLISVFVMVLFLNSLTIAQTGKISGKVIDKLNGEPLPGANLIFKGLNIGAATDFDGKFLITNIPVGEQKLTVSYIGYEPKEVVLTIVKNRVVSIDVELFHKTITGKTVVVTGQAEAQMAAINKQLSARSIKNVVSAKQIQEIPDANAAEAVGRLPGVSLIRNGGEGSKVVIRGLSPKYNKILVEGVKMAATGSDDRSSDLSMISPYMLEGIEVSKAALPDKEADVIGGSVNFILREAPKGIKYDVLAQSSYNGLKSTLGDYKFVASGSNRFLNDKLGIFAQIDVEKRNRSSYELNVNYTNFNSPLNPDDVDVSISTLLLKDISRDINRYGGTVVIDYKLPNGKIKLSNFISSIRKNYLNRFENYRPFFVDHFYTFQDAKNDLTVMTNSLRVQNSFSGINLDVGVSYAFSKNESPRSVTFQGYEPGAFDVTRLDYEASPDSIPLYAKNDINSAYLYDVTLATSSTKESEISTDFNLDYTINISKSISALVKAGTKYKHLSKKFDKEVKWMPIHWGGGEPSASIDKILRAYPEMQKKAPLGSIRLPYNLFVDPDYHQENFLGGNYTIRNMPKSELANNIADLLLGSYFYSYPKSIKDDYNGREDYLAGYIMSDINIGNVLTIIPGIRYERNETEYTGIRGNQQSKLEHKGYRHSDTTTIRKNDFFLPMLHVKYKPFNWFDLRVAYTNTLSRPNYNQIIPSWNRTLTNVVWNNPYLRPSQSKNIDLYASFYSNEIGLFTVGGFYKEIKDLIFWAGIGSIIDPKEYGLPEITAGKTISKMVNNKFPVLLRGIELEWQTHFWYLPGILKGVVFNINYTHTSSSVKYPRTVIKTKYLNKAPWVHVTNIDTFFTDRLINQPNNILNMTLGFDYKGFSTRISMIFQDDIFAKSNFWKRHRGTSAQYTRWDISIRQKLPIDGLEVLGNFNNITATIEQDLNVGTGYPIKEQHYGSTMDIGIRYRLQ